MCNRPNVKELDPMERIAIFPALSSALFLCD
jgi:hypothetical protein